MAEGLQKVTDRHMIAQETCMHLVITETETSIDTATGTAKAPRSYTQVPDDALFRLISVWPAWGLLQNLDEQHQQL